MSAREIFTAVAIGLVVGVVAVGALWLVLDAYTRIAYASLGLPYPG